MAALVVVAYANLLRAPFVLDDDLNIVRNPYLESLWPLTRAARAPVQSSISGRPLSALSFALSYASGGGRSPAAFRAFNVAILGASALLLFAIARRIAERFWKDQPRHAHVVATGIAALWVVHPLQTEVVGYVTQRTESLMGLCYLATLWASMRAIDSGARSWYALALVSCAAGMACKESMVTAPLAVLLYDAALVSRSFVGALKARPLFYAGLAATWILLLVLIMDAPRSGSAGFSTGVGVLTYAMNQAVMIARYLRLAVWPADLVLDYGRTTPISVAAAALPGLAVILLLMAVAFAWQRIRLLGFLGCWFFLTLAPSSSILPIATEVGAERRMYLPLAALCAGFVIGVDALAQRMRASATAKSWLVGAVCASGVAILLALTIGRNGEYRTPIDLWQTVVDRHPHGRAHYNLGLALKEAGRPAEALEHYRAAVADEPSAHYALGFEAFQRGALDEAASQFEEFLRLKPNDESAPRAWLLLGDARSRAGQTPAAEAAYRNALRLVPTFADAFGALADMLFARGRYEEAIVEYRKYLELMPASVDARHSLGLSLAFTGREREAIPEFERALSLRPQEPRLHLSLATALASAQRCDAALPHYMFVIQTSPGEAQAYSAAGLCQAKLGHQDEAAALFKKALDLDSRNPAVRSDIASAATPRRNRR